MSAGTDDAMAYVSATSGRVVSTVKLTADEVAVFVAVSVATARTWYTPSVLSVPLGIVYEYVDPLVALVSADPVLANVESPAPVIWNCTVATPTPSVTEAESVGAVEFVYALAVGAVMLTVGAVVSITSALAFPSDPEAPGLANVSVAAFPAASLIVPPFKPSDVVAA